MKVGLTGHRGAGKTTIFNMLTGLQAQVGGYGGKEEVHLGVIKVPDVRIDKLSRIYKPKKTTYAEIRFTDFPPSEGEENLKSNNSLITQMREVDAIALVLRDFESGADPLKELNDLLTDMILADLTVVENRRAFLKEIGIKEPARDRFIHTSYALLNLISFLTTGEDEVRAWTVTQGTNARKAAGKIHSDIERGFIRAEVIAYEDFIALGSEAKC